MSKDTNAFQPDRESKRSQFAPEAGGATKSNTVKILALVAAVLVGVAVYFVAGSGGGAGGAAGAGNGGLKAEGGEVSIPVSELSAKARFYEYKTASGKTVRFFAMRSPDGTYRAALDACDVCFAAKKGYSQQGENMICNKCGLPFHTSKINEVSGGCNPVGVQRKVTGDRLTINARELEAGESYF